MTFLQTLFPILVPQTENMASLALGAETLHRAAISGNTAAILEIENGLHDLEHWEFAGLIEKNPVSGGYVLRDTSKGLVFSGSVPLGNTSKAPSRDYV